MVSHIIIDTTRFFINDHKMILYNFPLKTAQKHDLVL